jgi:hypothetical protein
MFTGGLCGSGALAFVIWSYAMSECDGNGLVELRPELLTKIIGGTTEEEIEKAISFLCQPNPRSRVQDCDGKYLIELGGYLYEAIEPDRYGPKFNRRWRAQWAS